MESIRTQAQINQEYSNYATHLGDKTLKKKMFQEQIVQIEGEIKHLQDEMMKLIQEKPKTEALEPEVLPVEKGA